MHLRPGLKQADTRRSVNLEAYLALSLSVNKHLDLSARADTHRQARGFVLADPKYRRFYTYGRQAYICVCLSLSRIHRHLQRYSRFTQAQTYPDTGMSDVCKAVLSLYVHPDADRERARTRIHVSIHSPSLKICYFTAARVLTVTPSVRTKKPSRQDSFP